MLHRALVLLVVASSGIAAAQPSLTAPAPYAYVPAPVQLTPDEQSTLQIGYVSDGQLIGGGLASLFLSFGIGQAIEGRWGDTGWIFTLGEPAAVAVVVYGALQLATCDTPRGGTCNNTGGTALAVGMIGLVGLRIWEIVDAFTGPGRQNARFQAVQAKLGIPAPFYASPYIVPASGGAVAGLSLRF